MAEEKSAGQGESDFPDPKGMQGWLEREIADIHKASELRIKEATRFVNEYARGEISADEAAKRSFEYANRWGDAIPGVPRTQGLTDDEILARLNETRVKEGLLDKHVLSRRKGGAPETSR
jgi:hypothetical protein